MDYFKNINEHPKKHDKMKKQELQIVWLINKFRVASYRPIEMMLVMPRPLTTLTSSAWDQYYKTEYAVTQITARF